MAWIYIIRHKRSDNCYIGSTNDFEKRKSSHMSIYKNEISRKYNIKLYTFIRENGGWDNFDMVKICECDKDERVKIEQHHMDFMKPYLNCKNALGENIENRKERDIETSRLYRNREEYRKKWKEKYNREKETICEERKEKMTCDCGSIVRKVDITRHYRTLKHQRLLASSSCANSSAI